MIKIILVIICLFGIVNSYGRDFIIGGIPEIPNRWFDRDRNIIGLDVDIVDYIFNEIGIEYRIILEDSSGRLKQNWMKDKPVYDMVFTYSIKSSRQEYLIYANESHISFSWNFFIRKEDEGKIKYNEFEDLKNNTIGITKDFAYTEDFWNAVNNRVFKVDYSVKNSVQIKKLLLKRFDAVPLNTVTTLYELKTNKLTDELTYLPKPIKDKPYYNTFTKKSDYPNIDYIIIKYDEILKRMKIDGTLDELLKKYGL